MERKGYFTHLPSAPLAAASRRWDAVPSAGPAKSAERARAGRGAWDGLGPGWRAWKEHDDLFIGKHVTDANGKSLGGLRKSTKMIELERTLRATPKEDKTIIYSYFKGGLDVVEALLIHMNARTPTQPFDFLRAPQHGSKRLHPVPSPLLTRVGRGAGFDGDDTAEERWKQLKIFQQHAAKRIFLMSIGTGGAPAPRHPYPPLSAPARPAGASTSRQASGSTSPPQTA